MNPCAAEWLVSISRHLKLELLIQFEALVYEKIFIFEKKVFFIYYWINLAPTKNYLKKIL